eukprot:SAG31_NODE_10378_length_1139_cov_0.997135_1_plen_199_part_00
MLWCMPAIDVRHQQLARRPRRSPPPTARVPRPIDDSVTRATRSPRSMVMAEQCRRRRLLATRSALALVCLPARAPAVGEHEIHVWWKPANASSLASDVASMRSQLFVTDVIIYCGMAVLANGTVGAEPTRPGARPGSDDWGLPELCPAAIEAAADAGLGVQVILEGRATATGAGTLGAALSRGGATVGGETVRFLSRL